MANVVERPNTFDDMIQEINPILCPNMYTAVVILLVMPVSTAKLPHQSSRLVSCDATMRTECLSGLVLKHAHKDKTLDAELIIHQFSRSALTFHPNKGEGDYPNPFCRYDTLVNTYYRSIIIAYICLLGLQLNGCYHCKGFQFVD